MSLHTLPLGLEPMLFLRLLVAVVLGAWVSYERKRLPAAQKSL